MALPNAVRVQYEPLRSLAHGSISSSYAAIGTPFANPIRMITIYNATDVTLTFSYDGTNDHGIVPTATILPYEYCANRSDQGGYMFQAEGTTVYVKGAPSTGSVYITVIYAV